MTDDLDSMTACAILKAARGWRVERVMLFAANPERNRDFLGQKVGTEIHEQVGVDFAMCKGKCFDNHLTKFNREDASNEESINPNHLEDINRNNYVQKYNLSTTLLLWSLFDLPKAGLTDELMMLLLCIDSGYYSFYKQKFHDAHKKWLVEVLDLPEFYYCEKRHGEDEFRKIISKYRTKEKIKGESGYLYTAVDVAGVNEQLAQCDIRIELPKQRFAAVDEFWDRKVNLEGYSGGIEGVADNPFCYALTRKNEVKVSTVLENV